MEIINNGSIIVPDWTAPINVKAYSTTRLGGFSSAPYDSFNLGDHVGDDPACVHKNRTHLKKIISLPAEPLWLTQVHRTDILNLDQHDNASFTADGSMTTQSGKICTIMTADCLPVLLCDRNGTCVAALHAGWKGLAAGILQKGVEMLPAEPNELMAWLGPCISAYHYEVGDEVRQAFANKEMMAQQGFRPSEKQGHWYMDMYVLARLFLEGAGLNRNSIYGGGFCTFKDSERFYSYRRDGKTGRMASLICLE